MVKFASTQKYQRINWIRLEMNTIVFSNKHIWSKTILKGHCGANCRHPSKRGSEKFTILQWEKYCVLARTGVLGNDFRRILQVILETVGKFVFEKATV